MSRGYSFLVRHLLGLPFHDTETGYKFFRRESVLPLLDEIEDGGWFWDTEFMARAHRRGLRVVEIPGAYVRAARTRPRPFVASATRPATSSGWCASAPIAEPPRVKALSEIGWRRAAASAFFTLPWSTYRLASSSAAGPWLRLLGAERSEEDRRPRRPVFILPARARRARDRDECFLGDECLLDLARGHRLERQVTLAERVLLLTHLNVGYHDTRSRCVPGQGRPGGDRAGRLPRCERDRPPPGCGSVRNRSSPRGAW